MGDLAICIVWHNNLKPKFTVQTALIKIVLYSEFCAKQSNFSNPRSFNGLASWVDDMKQWNVNTILHLLRHFMHCVCANHYEVSATLFEVLSSFNHTASSLVPVACMLQFFDFAEIERKYKTLSRV